MEVPGPVDSELVMKQNSEKARACIRGGNSPTGESLQRPNPLHLLPTSRPYLTLPEPSWELSTSYEPIIYVYR